MHKKADPSNIAIIRTDRIGEVLLSAMAVDAVKKTFPEANVFFVTSEYSKVLVEGRDDIKEVFTMDTSGKKNIFSKAIKLGRFLRDKNVDLTIVLNPHKALHLGCFLGGVPVRAGFDRKWGFFLNRKIKDLRDGALKHEIRYTCDLLEELDIKVSDPEPRLSRVGLEDDEKEGLGVDNTPSIAVHPGSSNLLKIWPKEKYADLISRISEELGVKVLLLGAENERPLTDEIESSSEGDIVNLSGKVNLKYLIRILEEVKIFVGNDSGPMHMAAASGCSVVAIFRDTGYGGSPVRWRPWGDGHVVFHETDLPLEIPECDYRPLKEVTVDDVFNAVREKL